jgi:tRNA U34 2-thiouridine synthase MnmA/TrmU
MRIKALALISGGLDSLLAARLIKNQGVEVVGIHFKIPFCKRDGRNGCSDIGIEVLQIDLENDFLPLLKNPRYGFGSRLNPCIDCKILMFSRAKHLLSELSADFIVTGEVLGQRPMSQNRQSLELIRQRSGLDDLLLRPLSAQFLSPSLAEKMGWVSRDKLLGFNGRIRTPQIQMADKLGISKYETPAGGCLLTDPCFSRRLAELLKYDELNLHNLELLKIGRHFRLDKKTKLVVGRNESENNLLMQMAVPGDYLFFPNEETAGPTSLSRGTMDSSLIRLSSQITASYSDTAGLESLEISYRNIPDSMVWEHKVNCLPKSGFTHLLI